MLCFRLIYLLSFSLLDPFYHVFKQENIEIKQAAFDIKLLIEKKTVLQFNNRLNTFQTVYLVT